GDDGLEAVELVAVENRTRRRAGVLVELERVLSAELVGRELAHALLEYGVHLALGVPRLRLIGCRHLSLSSGRFDYAAPAAAGVRRRARPALLFRSRSTSCAPLYRGMPVTAARGWQPAPPR